MRTIPYSSLERGLAAIAGIDVNNLLAHEKAQFAEYINDATKFVWEHYPWPETTRVEKRYFRPLWVEGQNYEIGDEVFFNKKYYRKFADYQTNTSEIWEDKENWTDASRNWFPFVSPDESSVWHQTGDRFDVDDYREEGLYATGALVSFEEKVYLCIKTPTGDPTDPTSQFTNFSQNGIGLSNPSYWQEVDTTFYRYIGYDQEGKSVIGTLFSVHTDDPRYYSSTPLNWQLGREGVYINLPFETNEVWVKFREEPPTYSSGDSDIPVLNYLASAIKAYAYRSFLISDGQNEKAMLQEQMALDLLVKEIDKLVHQQDRGVKGFKAIAI